MERQSLGLSVRTWITMMILAAVMALNNIYSTLLTGWGDGGSIIAVVLCLIFISKRDSSIINYNLGQTMASAGGSVGFTTTIVAAVYVNQPDWDPNLAMLTLFVTALSVLGVTLAIPMRRHTVKWFFPGAVACATILDAVTSEDERKGGRAKAVLIFSGAISALLTFPTKVATKVGGGALWSKWTFGDKTSLSLDPIFYGIGIVVGPRIGVSMLLGAIGVSFWYIPMLINGGHAEELSDYVKWGAVAFMTLPAFSTMFFQRVYNPPQQLPGRFQNVVDRAEPWTAAEKWRLTAISLLALAVAVFSMSVVFGVSTIYTIAAIVIGAPLCIMLGKVASTTDINPVRLLAVILLFIISFFGTHSPVTILGIGIAGAALASIAVDLFYDLRTGYLVEANPKQQVKMQYIGVLIAGGISVLFLHMLASNYGFGEGQYFPAPGAVVWSTMADGFASGGSSVSSGVWLMVGIVSVIGVLMSFLECHPLTRKFAPSPFAIGISMLLDFDMSAAICAGSLIQLFVVLWGRMKDRREYISLPDGESHEEQHRSDAFQGGSAIFAAAAITGIIAVILITLGVFSLPASH